MSILYFAFKYLKKSILHSTAVKVVSLIAVVYYIGLLKCSVDYYIACTIIDYYIACLVH